MKRSVGSRGYVTAAFLTCLVFFIASCWATPGFAYEKRALTVDDYLKVASVGDVFMSPCGNYVF